VSGRVAGLDVLRGVAILLVMLRHAVPGVFQGAGVVGVVVFFALSGYLITGVLQRDLAERGRVRFGHFYLRRAARLLPALLVLVAVFAAVTLLLDPIGDRDRLPATTAVLLTFTANLPIADISPAAFHAWTLATEEQFYLLWPAVLAIAWPRRRTATALALSAFLAIAACTATLVWLWPHLDNAYALPTSWWVCFVIGAAARLHGTPERVPRWMVPVALAGLAALAVVPLRGHALTYLVAGPAIAALTAILLLRWSSWQSTTNPATRALAALGVLSYGAYLWNYPLTLWLRPHLDGWAGPVAAALTVVAAVVSWRWVEEPVMRRQSRRRTRALDRQPR
jgi:peptidoglycan/LPS O-acetylase OafA/YrhL